MEKKVKIIIGILVSCFLVLFGIIIIATFLPTEAVDVTNEAVDYLEECPMPQEMYNFSRDLTQEDIETMIEWCCANYDNSHELCRLIEEKNN